LLPVTDTDTIQPNITLNINSPKQNEETGGSTWRLLQYCHLLDKYSCHISVDIWNFLQHFNIFIYFFHNFLWNPQLRSAEPWLVSTDVKFLKERLIMQRQFWGLATKNAPTAIALYWVAEITVINTIHSFLTSAYHN